MTNPTLTEEANPGTLYAYAEIPATGLLKCKGMVSDSQREFYANHFAGTCKCGMEHSEKAKVIAFLPAYIGDRITRAEAAKTALDWFEVTGEDGAHAVRVSLCGVATQLEKPYIERCPKGKHSYSRHRLETVSRKETSPGIFAVSMRCKVCGGTCESVEDFTVLAGTFSV